MTVSIENHTLKSENAKPVATIDSKGLTILAHKPTWVVSDPASYKAAKIEPMTEEMARSVGGGIGWALAGGVLTGGIGLVVGAAFGARKKGEALFAVTTTSGDRFLVKCTKPKEVSAMNSLIARMSFA